MLRKTLITLTAVAALGASSTAMAKGGGHSNMGAMHGSMGSHSSMGAMHSNWGSHSSMGAMHSNWGSHSKAMAPMHSNWHAKHAFFHNKFHRFHHRNVFFVGAGFAGYDSCWVWTYWGWRYVCGYPYWTY